MKRTLLAAALLCAATSASAQTPDAVRRAEYFFDTDPGVGQGTSLTVPAADDTVNFSGSVAVPAGMSAGEHTLYVRTYADTTGAGGRWSMARAAMFTVERQVVAAEYFFDADPGVGMGVPLPAFSATDSVDFGANISTTGLAPGRHTLYVRTRGNTGAWSLSRDEQFYVQDAVAAAEYFFDVDPGVGAATPLAASFSADDSVDVSASISTAGLGAGDHKLYVRTRTSTGVWSLASVEDFYITSAVAAAEYFIDTDPGVGAGTPLHSFTADDSVDQNFSIVLPANLSRGGHRLFVRTRSSRGDWSLAHEQDFFVRNSIVAAEYFWDIDPGVGAATALALTPAVDSIDQNFSITAPCLSPGTHHLFVRARDATGVWGLASADTVIVDVPTLVLTAEYPGPGPQGTPVKVKASGGIGPYTYRVGAGTFSTDSIFLVSNGGAFTFEGRDGCNYAGLALVNTPPTPTNIASGPRGGDTVLSKGWRHWFYILDSAGHLVGAMKDGAQALGEVRFTFYKNTGPVRQFGTGMNANRHYLDRNWLIQPANAPTSPVGISLYALNSEFNALNTADPDPTFDNISDLYITKYDGPNEDLQWSNNSGGGSAMFPADSSTIFSGATSAGYGLWFSVSGFSEFYQSGNYSIPLAQRELWLDARESERGVTIAWRCEREADVKHYTLQRQFGAGDWKDLTAMQPTDGHYEFLDEDMTTGARAYRVRLTDVSGAVSFSRTANLYLKGSDGSAAVFPVPAKDVLHVSGLTPGAALRITDVAGHVLRRFESAERSATLSLQGLATGAYWLQVEDQSGPVSTHPFTIRD